MHIYIYISISISIYIYMYIYIYIYVYSYINLYILPHSRCLFFIVSTLWMRPHCAREHVCIAPRLAQALLFENPEHVLMFEYPEIVRTLRIWEHLYLYIYIYIYIYVCIYTSI